MCEGERERGRAQKVEGTGAHRTHKTDQCLVLRGVISIYFNFPGSVPGTGSKVVGVHSSVNNCK